MRRVQVWRGQARYGANVDPRVGVKKLPIFFTQDRSQELQEFPQLSLKFAGLFSRRMIPMTDLCNARPLVEKYQLQ